MNEQEMRREISSRVSVTRQDIALAKTFILNNFNTESNKLLQRFLEHVQAHRLDKFVLHDSVPYEPQVKQVASFLSWRLAFDEALWSLIGEAIILPAGSNLFENEAHQEWTTVVRNSGGYSAGWRFEEYKIAFPQTIRLAPSLQGKAASPLSDSDLYLSELAIPDIPPDVEDALRQAVLCFRHELYLPAVAMLGMASEGSWIELGLSLLRANPADPNLTSDKRDKTLDLLTSPHSSVLQKMEGVMDLYRKQDVYGNVAKRSGYNHRTLATVLNWSNVIRDSRNALHYGADSASRNTYEKVAALLLGANQNLQIIYAIRRSAQEFS
jgi:hypothetical protein